jgi:acid phosphatase type 7
MDFSFHNQKSNQANQFIAKQKYDASPYRDLPEPTSPAPYHLDITEVIKQLPSATKMVFQTVGDSGAIKVPQDQKLVADKMEEQFIAGGDPADLPIFFYHLGDVVYYYGEEKNYFDQFFEPYIHYPAPIFAIAGNHDGDIDPTDPNPPTSLAAFMKVFCDSAPHHLPIAGDSSRTTMIQPNVYWTLVTPLANFLGLYCNDTQHGEIREPQTSWFINELKSADKERKDTGKAIIVTLHYPAYSVDMDHGSSGTMQKFLDDAFASAEVYPDIVLSGHVHNYQRFTRTLNNGNDLPYIVAGAGGYWNLHKVQTKANPVNVPNGTFFPDVVLENFCDDRFGFLKITIENKQGARTLKGEYFTVPRPQESWSAPATLFDTFTIDLNNHKLQKL